MNWYLKSKVVSISSDLQKQPKNYSAFRQDSRDLRL